MIYEFKEEFVWEIGLFSLICIVPKLYLQRVLVATEICSSKAMAWPRQPWARPSLTMAWPAVPVSRSHAWTTLSGASKGPVRSLWPQPTSARQTTRRQQASGATRLRSTSISPCPCSRRSQYPEPGSSPWGTAEQPVWRKEGSSSRSRGTPTGCSSWSTTSPGRETSSTSRSRGRERAGCRCPVTGAKTGRSEASLQGRVCRSRLQRATAKWFNLTMSSPRTGSSVRISMEGRISREYSIVCNKFLGCFQAVIHVRSHGSRITHSHGLKWNWVSPPRFIIFPSFIYTSTNS